MFDRRQLDLWLERGILLLVLAVLLVAPLATGAVGRASFLVVQTLTAGVMALFGLRLLVQPEPKLLWPPLAWIILAFALYAVGRYFTADLEIIARRELLRVLVYAFLFFAVVNNLHRQEHGQIIAFTLMGLGVLEAGYAIYQFVSGSNLVWNLVNPYRHRGTGTYINPNHLAGLLEMILPLSLAYLLLSRAKPLAKVFIGYAAVMMLAGILVSVSRASWMAVAVTLLVLCLVLLRYPNFRLRVAVLMLLLLIGALAAVRETDRFMVHLKTTPQPGNWGHDSRVAIWDAAWTMWRDHPWFGVGPGHFDYRFREYRPANLQARPDRVHNDYLNTLTDWGVAGAAIALAGLAALAVSVAQIWPHVRRGKKDFGDPLTNKFAFVLGASLGLFALAIHSAMDFNLQIPANAILAFVLAALLTGFNRFATERYWVRVGPWRRGMALTGLTAGVALFAWQDVRQGREEFWLRRAETAPPPSPQRQQFLERAFAAEPNDFELAYTIGELCRDQSWNGYGDADALARQAMGWYDRALQLNPYDAYSVLRTGMCLDWLGETNRAEPLFRQADALDPTGYYTAANIGWHFVQVNDYAAAWRWFERSLDLESKSNHIAESYLRIVQERLAEQARAPAAGQ